MIWLMMRGGVSHLESFDPKPELNKHAGKTIAESAHKAILDSPYIKNVREQVANNIIDKQKARIYPLQIGFKPGGQSGIQVSDWWPHLRECVDDIAVIRSMYTTDNNHGAQMEFLTGRHLLDGCHPTIGAWIHYGLGSLSDDLPQFISMGPALESQCFGGVDSGYLGPEHAGVSAQGRSQQTRCPTPDRSVPVSTAEATVKADVLSRLNQLAAVEYPGRPQAACPDSIVRAGLPHADGRPRGPPVRRRDRARPAALRSRPRRHAPVRPAAPGGPPAGGARGPVHPDLSRRRRRRCVGCPLRPPRQSHKPLCPGRQANRRITDRPETAGIARRHDRGLGHRVRPDAVRQGADGRDHHNYGFSVWMAGGGIKGGVVHGATDELGFHAVENRHYVTDIHATVLHLLGLDSHRLEIPGRKRLEIEHGKVIRSVLA